MIDQIILPRTSDIGNFEVHRALPSRLRRMVGPFIFWDQMGPGEFLSGQGLDVRPHPHIGLSTLTYLFDGEIVHRDSLGVNQTIKQGDINLMTAGKGITHSERTDTNFRLHPHQLFGIQSWLALPMAHEECDPAFIHLNKSHLPVMQEKDFDLRLIAGTMFGKKSPMAFPHDAIYADIRIRAGGKISIPANAEERALYPLSGRLIVGDTVYDPMQLLILKPGEAMTLSAESDTHVMLLGGAVMDSPRYIWWNFVSSSQERLEEAKQNWKNNQFPHVPGETEFIPLPE